MYYSLATTCFCDDQEARPVLQGHSLLVGTGFVAFFSLDDRKYVSPQLDQRIFAHCPARSIEPGFFVQSPYSGSVLPTRQRGLRRIGHGTKEAVGYTAVAFQKG